MSISGLCIPDGPFFRSLAGPSDRDEREYCIVGRFSLFRDLRGGTKGFALPTSLFWPALPPSPLVVVPTLDYRWKRSLQSLAMRATTLTPRWLLSSLGAPRWFVWSNGARVLVCHPVPEATQYWEISSTCLPTTFGRHLVPGVDNMVGFLFSTSLHTIPTLTRIRSRFFTPI